MKKSEWRIILRISLIYALFGALWILLSDRLVSAVVQDTFALTRIQTFKGWFYIAVTTILLSILLQRELTVRRATEEERDQLLLREQAARADAEAGREHYRHLFEGNPMPMWVYEIQTMAFLAVNDAAIRHYGYSEQEFLSMTLRDIRPSEEVAQLENLISSLQTGYHNSGIWTHRKMNGDLIRVEVIGNDVPFNGRRARLVLVNDITDRLQAEANLRQTSEILQAVVDSSPLAIVSLDHNSNISLWNRAAEQIFGWSSDEVIGKSVPYIPLEKQEEFLSLNQRVMTGETLTGLDMQRMRKDGSIVDVSISTAPLRDTDGRITSSMAVLADVTESKRSQQRIQRQLQRLAALRTIDLAISASLDLRISLTVLLDHVVTQMQVDAAAVLLHRSQNRQLEYGSRRGFRHQVSGRLYNFGEGLAGRVAVERHSIQIDNLPAYMSSLPESARMHLADAQAEGFQAYIGVPLVAKGHVRGVLEIFNRSPLMPDDESMEFLETLAGQAAIAIDNSTLFNDLQQSNTDLTIAYDATIEGWSRAVDLRDRETENHTLRVTDLTLKLAQAMKLQSADLVHIRRGALLHDIGKLGVPDRILLKRGPLNKKEWDIMRQHPVHANQMLWPIVYLRPALDIPYCHHEKWDGSGYPRGMRNEQIPLSARIFAIVDVWDALTSDRPYRKAWTAEATRQYIKDQVGSHFDPHVFSFFERLLLQEPL